MARYDVRVGDYGSDSAVRVTLTRAGDAMDLTGATLTATAVSPGGRVHWPASAFSVVTASTGIIDIIAPDETYWDMPGPWTLIVEADDGTSVAQSDDVNVSVGRGQVRADDPYEQTFTAGTINHEGMRIHGEGFLTAVIATGQYYILTETKIRNEADCVLVCDEISQDGDRASITWASGNAFLIAMVDENGAASNGTATFMVADE